MKKTLITLFFIIYCFLLFTGMGLFEILNSLLFEPKRMFTESKNVLTLVLDLFLTKRMVSSDDYHALLYNPGTQMVTRFLCGVGLLALIIVFIGLIKLALTLIFA